MHTLKMQLDKKESIINQNYGSSTQKKNQATYVGIMGGGVLL